MKKFIVVLSIISILFLAGCTVNENSKDNELSGDMDNQQQETIENGTFSNEQLIEMVKKYREARGEYIPEFIIVEDETNNIVTIHLYDIVIDHTATSDWYYINRNSGIGEDFFGERIDLNNITEQENNIEEINDIPEKESEHAETLDNYDVEIEKYKLSDGYIFDIEQEGTAMLTDESRFNMGYEKQTVESDGVLFEITYEGSDGYILKSTYTGEITYMGQYIWLVDLETEDNYKEIVSVGYDYADYYVYRLKKDSVEQIKKFDNGINTKSIFDEGSMGLYRYNDKYLFPFYEFNARPGNSVIEEYDIIKEKILTGYLLYENDKFVYINRFANGEVMTDDKGNFNEKFKNEVFETVVVHTILDDKEKFIQIPAGTKIRFLRDNVGNSYDDYEYEIEICEDVDCFIEEVVGDLIDRKTEKYEVHLEKGKVLKCNRNDIKENIFQQVC